MTGSPWIAAAAPGSTGSIVVTTVGAAGGSAAAAAALACAGSEADRAALVIDLGQPRGPRSSLLATAGAQRLEERLATHLPDADLASRGCICQLTLPAEASGIERIAAALPLARESLAIVHVPPSLLQVVLDEPRIDPGAALLRADLASARSLTALAAGDLVERGLRVAVLKRPLGWLAARAALLGALPEGRGGLPARLVQRLLAPPRAAE